MNLNDICISKNAQFFILNKPLTKKIVAKTFKDISQDRIGNYLVNRVRESYVTIKGNSIVFSLVSFKLHLEPSFLKSTTIREEKYALLLLIECGNTLAVIKKYIDSPEKYFENFIDFYSYGKFCHLYGSRNPEYERVSMKNMSISNAVIRARSLEAKSLNGIISSNSSSRAVPTSFRMNVQQDVYTLSPGASRVIHRDKKIDFNDLIDWVADTKNELNLTGIKSTFLNNFASPVSLQDIINAGFNVSAIFLDLNEIEEKYSLGHVILKKNGGITLSSKEIQNLFGALKNPIKISNNKMIFKGFSLRGKITLGKSAITIHNNILSSINVEESSGEKYTLSSYLNKVKPFSAVFSTPSYSYYSRSCFEDRSLLNNINSILNVFNDTFLFNRVSSEKEKPHAPNLTRFPSTSLFRAVEDGYCNSYNITLCDDMNDEWADHIAINTDNHIPEIAFIHSKYVKKETYGASAFHEVVAQALKNIGRTQASKSEFEDKYNKTWKFNYEHTQIPRARGAASWNELEQALDIVNGNPNAVKKIVLATPFLKKTTLRTELLQIQAGGYSKPHYTQLIWLISTFLSSCKEYGVQAHILCKP